MVLEARDHLRPAFEVGLDRAVADQARARLADRAQVHQPDSGQLLVAELVAAAEQLVAAADRQDHGAVVGRRVERIALRGEHVAGDRHLVAVLAAAHVEEVVRVRIETVGQRGAGQLEAKPAPLAARPEHRQVAAVRVDVHQLRVERAHAQDRGHASSTTVEPR